MHRKVKTRYISWSMLHESLKNLAEKISSEYTADTIIAIAKGGLIPARILVDLLGIDEMGFIEVKFYRGIAETREKPYVTFTALPQLDNKRIIIVDDIVDTGRTLQVVADVLSRFKYRDMKFAALYVKPWSTIMPDYYSEIVDEWIIFPWEICESIRENAELKGVDVEGILDYCKRKHGFPESLS